MKKYTCMLDLKKSFGEGELEAFLGLFGDVFSKIGAVIGTLLIASNFPSEIVVGRMLPGIAMSSIIGTLIYYVMSVKLSKKFDKDITALPFGIASTQLFAWMFIVIIPVYIQTEDPLLAWRIGLASCFVGGIIEALGGVISKYIIKYIPNPALLGNMSAGAMVWLSINSASTIFGQPVLTVVPIFFALINLFYKEKVFPKISNSVLILIFGCVIFWVTGTTSIQSVKQSMQYIGFYSPKLAILDLFHGLRNIPQFLSIIIPLEISNFLSTLQAVESAKAAGDPYDSKSAMLFDGITSMIASVFGSPFPTTVYYGHQGWKRCGARSGYLLMMIVPYLLCFMGIPTLLLAVVPYEVVLIFLFVVGLSVAMEVDNDFNKDQSLILYLSMIPILAQYTMGLLEQFYQIVSPGIINFDELIVSHNAFRGIYYLSNGAFASSLLYSVWISYIQDKKYKYAGLTMFALALLSFIGFIHNKSLEVCPRETIPFTLGYLVIFDLNP